VRTPGIEAVTELLAEAAREEILPRFQNLAGGDVREKSPGEVVTAADEAMERRLEDGLRSLLPGSVWVGEESASADEALLERLSGEAPVWVVDPLDGTASFAQGRPVFGVMACLVHQGETVAAWIHLPVTGQTAAGERGSGAFLEGKRLSIRPVRQPLRAAISTRFFPDHLRVRAGELLRRFDAREPWHCAARTYLDLLTGELDIAVYYRLMPWDHAPGVFLHGEAGGFSTRFNGEPYSVAIHTGGLMLAPSAESWREAAPLLGGPA
jgi:fructose-1,6-bisphosphatase/inositol monophosphatase family enzyme